MVNIYKGTHAHSRTHTLCTSQYMHMLRHRRLIWDLVLVILDHVVGSTPVAEEAVLDDFDDEGSCIFLAQTRVESLLEQFDGLSSEARKTSVQHEVD